MTTPLTITFPLKLFSPEKFGLTRAQAASEPGRLAENVAELLGEIFQKIGQNARIAATQNDNDYDLPCRIRCSRIANMHDAETTRYTRCT